MKFKGNADEPLWFALMLLGVVIFYISSFWIGCWAIIPVVGWWGYCYYMAHR
jgi:hypothetical protein